MIPSDAKKDNGITLDNTGESMTYLTPEQLSERWGNTVVPRTLANWRCLAKGPRYMKAGGKVVYPLDEIEAWEKGRLAGSTSEYTSTGKRA